MILTIFPKLHLFNLNISSYVRNTVLKPTTCSNIKVGVND